VSHGKGETSAQVMAEKGVVGVEVATKVPRPGGLKHLLHRNTPST
jgi:hypothetical protein